MNDRRRSWTRRDTRASSDREQDSERSRAAGPDHVPRGWAPRGRPRLECSRSGDDPVRRRHRRRCGKRGGRAGRGSAVGVTGAEGDAGPPVDRRGHPRRAGLHHVVDPGRRRDRVRPPARSAGPIRPGRAVRGGRDDRPRRARRVLLAVRRSARAADAARPGRRRVAHQQPDTAVGSDRGPARHHPRAGRPEDASG